MDAELSFSHVVRPRRIGMSSRWKTSSLARSRFVRAAAVECITVPSGTGKMEIPDQMHNRQNISDRM